MSKLEKFDSWPSRSRTRILFVIGLVLAIFFNVITAIQLGRTNYPETKMMGPYPAWWFTFSGPELKSHYAILIEQGTINTFRVVQYLDYGLMASTGLFFFITALIIARQHRKGSILRSMGFMAALLLIAAPTMDIFENITLLIMLSNPLEYANWLAIVYSSFASAKVVLVTTGLVSVLFLSVVILMRIIRERLLREKAT